MRGTKDNFNTVMLWYFVVNMALTLYLYAFFPVKEKSVNAVTEPPSHVNGMRINMSMSYYSEVDRVLIIVIDALRRDFVQEKYMPYLVSQVRNGEGCVLTAVAESPTVTMPRIKAMTTGCVPQFIDVVLNFVTSEIQEDSLLDRLKASGLPMVFYGDDTWLKLFPDMFLRSEGTTSFYVSDYTEVDNNVTRHLPKELNETDWRYMFLHYLGLDHIGHMYGPNSLLINMKLREMDDIIHRIHTAMSKEANEKTLILVCGDHGMRDAGGHGGSTLAETLIPVAILGHKCGHDSKVPIRQTDIASTLAVLTGIPIPADNIGIPISELMDTLELPRQLFIYHYVAQNLINKNSRKYYNYFQDAVNKHARYLSTDDENLGKEALISYKKNALKTSQELIQNATTQNIDSLYIACAMSFIGTIMIFWETTRNIIKHSFLMRPITIVLISGTIISTLCLTSTSFIEEEHQIWYFFWGTLAITGAFTQRKQFKQNSLLWLVLFAGVRLLRTLNQVGDKWATEADVSDWLLHPKNKFWLDNTLIIGLCGVLYFSRRHHNDRVIGTLTFLTTLFVYLHRNSLKYNNQSNVFVRISWLIILAMAALTLVQQKSILKSSIVIWVLWSALVMQPYNVVLIPFFLYASRSLFKLCSDTESLVTSHMWLSSVLFHCQGNSNSLASIDVSVGYIGLTDFHPVVTTLQVIGHTYIFSVLSYLLLLSYTNERPEIFKILVRYRVLNISFYIIIMFLERHHLFIWTVFSPKLLIESCHLFGLTFGIVFYVACTSFNEFMQTCKSKFISM